MDLLNFVKKLRSKKHVMIEGELELSPVAQDFPMFTNANDISKEPGDKMGDIARKHAPELTHLK